MVFFNLLYRLTSYNILATYSYILPRRELISISICVSTCRLPSFLPRCFASFTVSGVSYVHITPSPLAVLQRESNNGFIYVTYGICDYTSHVTACCYGLGVKSLSIGDRAICRKTQRRVLKRELRYINTVS